MLPLLLMSYRKKLSQVRPNPQLISNLQILRLLFLLPRLSQFKLLLLQPSSHFQLLLFKRLRPNQSHKLSSLLSLHLLLFRLQLPPPLFNNQLL